MTEVKSDKVAMLDSSTTKAPTTRYEEVVEITNNTPRRDATVRPRKSKHGDRVANKGDGSLLLVWLLLMGSDLSSPNLLADHYIDKHQCVHS